MTEQEPSRNLLYDILSIALQLAILVIVLYCIFRGPPLSFLLFLLIFLLLLLRGRVFPSEPVDLIAQVILLPIALGVALHYGLVGIQVLALAYLLLFWRGNVFPSQFFSQQHSKSPGDYVLSGYTSKTIYYVLFLILSAVMWVTEAVSISAVEEDHLLLLLLRSNPALENWYWSILIAFVLVMIPTALILILDGLSMMNNYLADYSKGDYPLLPTLAAMISIRLGINKRVELVVDGKAKTLRAPGGGWARFAGPGLVIVVDGHAVALERSGKIRVVGAGVHFTGRYERVRLVVPLRTETAVMQVENVVTRDGIVIEQFNLYAFYQSEVGEGYQPFGSRFPFDRENIITLWKLVDNDYQKVKSTMEAISDTSLRDVIARHDLDEIFTARGAESPPTAGKLEPRQRIKNEVCDQINEISSKFMAIKVVAVDIGEVKIPEKAKDQLLQKWVAEWDQRIDTTRAETEKLVQVARATARMQTIQAIAQGLKQLLGKDAKPEDLIALRYIEYMEKAAETGRGEDGWATQQQIEAMQTFQRLGISPGEEPAVGRMRE
jgi:regulator of protease activity HflC (stomatin/prohibitin superfamily)